MLSGGSSLGSSTFISSSSWMGGRPDRRQILSHVSTPKQAKRFCSPNLLPVEHVSYPENTFALLNLSRI